MSIPNARAIIDVPELPFLVRQIAQIGGTVKKATVSPEDWGDGAPVVQLDMISPQAAGQNLSVKLFEGRIAESIVSDAGKWASCRNEHQSSGFVHIHKCLNECFATLQLAGKKIVRHKGWALDFLHQIRLSNGGDTLSFPENPANDDPNKLYFELTTIGVKPAGYIVDREGVLILKKKGDATPPASRMKWLASRIPLYTPIG